MQKVTVAEKLARITDVWHPRIVAELNGQHVKLVRIKGPFVWHHHEHEDELFFVVRGRMRLELQGQDPIELGPGELVVVPRGVEHRPVALDEAELMLFEPASTVNTGEVRDERTHLTLERM